MSHSTQKHALTPGCNFETAAAGESCGGIGGKRKRARGGESPRRSIRKRLQGDRERKGETRGRERERG
jgi:hypothetical protein